MVFKVNKNRRIRTKKCMSQPQSLATMQRKSNVFLAHRYLMLTTNLWFMEHY